MNLSGWNRPIETEADRLHRGRDGALYRGGERIRLFGVNLSEGAALPDPAVAKRLAARLARQGVNYVRIAQHSNVAPAGWFDARTAAGLDRQALDRLDGLVAHLRRCGIYVHLVLNHFRLTYPAEMPGFDRTERPPAGWPPLGTGVTQFYPPAIAQNRAAARELLTHRNRRTGLAYADDPAIAIIEVTNEDGLVQSWREGSLDSVIAGRAPHLRPLRDELQARWNVWLRTRYVDDAAARAAWARGASRGRGNEALANGNFAQGERGWKVEARIGARVRWRRAREDDVGAPPSMLEINGKGVGAEGWQVRIIQDRVAVRGERPYRISLWARADRSGARISVGLRQSRPPRHVLGYGATEWRPTEQWTRYFTRVSAGGGEPDAVVAILVGHEAGTVWIADVSLREDPASGLLTNESPADGTVPPLTRAALSLRTPQAQRDWIAFLADVERAFFADSYRFLREELHARSLLIGTQADFSSAGAQAGSDVTTMHAYWAHPIFPDVPWDPNNWLVRNRSMVAARDEWHTLNRLAFHRRDNKPFIVDEYDHPQPNSFGAEGFPLVAAYGSFQDWDGIAGWTFREGSRTAWLSAKDWARPAIRHYFALDADPVRQLSAWIAAVIFRRGDVAPAKHSVRLTVSAEQEQAIARTVGLSRQCEAIAGGAERLPLRHRVVVGSGAPGHMPPSPRREAGAVESDTGELAWEAPGIGGAVTVNTPRTKAVIGIGAGREFALGAVTIRPGRTAQLGFGVWAITAQDGDRPLHTARRLVIVTCGYSQNTEQQWRLYPNGPLKAGPPPADASITVGSAWGGPPPLAEAVPARIVLPASAGRVRVWALDATGRRRKRIPVRSERGLALVETDARHRTLWYEAVVAPSGRASPH